MKRAPYTNWITPEDRAAAIRNGVVVKMAADGVPAERVSDIIADMKTRMTKNSQAAADIPKTIILGSLLTGVPTGIMLHHLTQEAKKRSKKEDDLKEQIDFYNDVSRELETSMARKGVRI